MIKIDRYHNQAVVHRDFVPEISRDVQLILIPDNLIWT